MNTNRINRLALMGLGVMALFAAPAVAQFEPVLTLEGSCPGMLRAEVSRGRPDATAFLLFASETGSVAIPHNFCFGTRLGLGRRNLRQVAVQGLDRFGATLFEGMAGARACGGYLQVIVNTCETSNVVQIE